jgi:hypothetical protein
MCDLRVASQGLLVYQVGMLAVDRMGKSRSNSGAMSYSLCSLIDSQMCFLFKKPLSLSSAGCPMHRPCFPAPEPLEQAIAQVGPLGAGGSEPRHIAHIDGDAH